MKLTQYFSVNLITVVCLYEACFLLSLYYPFVEIQCHQSPPGVPSMFWCGGNRITRRTPTWAQEEHAHLESDSGPFSCSANHFTIVLPKVGYINGPIFFLYSCDVLDCLLSSGTSTHYILVTRSSLVFPATGTSAQPSSHNVIIVLFLCSSSTPETQ